MRGTSGTRLITFIQRALLSFPYAQVIDSLKHQRRYSGLLDTLILVFVLHIDPQNGWILVRRCLR